MANALPISYSELKEFLRAFAVRFMNVKSVPPEMHPLVLVESQEREAPARASAGLRMAVNDCIEMSSHWPVEKVAALDLELRSSGVLTLSIVRQRYWGKYAAVLKRGQIRSEIEYYLVRGVLADQALAPDSSEREKLEKMSALYEQHAL